MEEHLTMACNQCKLQYSQDLSTVRYFNLKINKLLPPDQLVDHLNALESISSVKSLEAYYRA